ncbi:MAG: UvrD-helicase domain-containing protein [Phycisphaerales bacterium]|nr:MAG: UvrD-helicase domain-containing protein [Phycisphaerales bacterium]
MDDTSWAQLTSSQKKAVCHKEGPLLVIAGPGSGKTRVITHRIAALINSGIRPYNICAITFTNKAAEEMRHRAVALGASGGAHISTFHSLCVRILRAYADEAGINRNFSIYDEADQRRCIKQAVKDCELDATNFSPARMLDAISTLKNKLIDVDAFGSQADDFFSQRLAQVYARYETILAERNGLDFDDLLKRTAFLLEGRSEVRRQLGDRFKFLLIDEYQDTNHAQYRIAKALASAHGNICATGDPDQSIYRWRGADIRNILAFESDWPDATVVRLEENFRSSADILEAADRLIAFNKNRKQKRLVPTRPHAKAVLVTSFEDEADEAEAVARQIEELVDCGTSLNEVAVFYRVNAMSRVIEEALIAGNIPYQIVRGVEFYSRKEIRDLLAYLKVLVNPSDEIALLRIINTPARGIGKVTIERVRNYAVRRGITFFEALKHAGDIDVLSKAAKSKLAAFVAMLERFKTASTGDVAPLAERVFSESGLEGSLRGAGAEGLDALENVDELITAVAQYDRQAEEPSLTDFLQQISLFSDADAYDASGNRVALMTLHAAKGLEFENVFVVGLEDGLLPHERGIDDEDELEEERRLFFVGITRAKTNLQVSYSRYRTIRGQMLRSVPSQFLFELGCGFDERSEEEDTSEKSEFDHHSMTAPEFAVGELVRHKAFGLGRVEKYVNMGGSSVVVVNFSSGQRKSLMVRYAGLSKMSDLGR